MEKDNCNNEDSCLDNCMEIGYAEYNLLKKKYEHAVKTSRESFKFCGKELLTAYAKYLLEYIRLKTNW